LLSGSARMEVSPGLDGSMARFIFAFSAAKNEPLQFPYKLRVPRSYLYL
jgi:hypothetical protein